MQCTLLRALVLCARPCEACVLSSPYTRRARKAMASSRNLSIAVVTFCLCALSTEGFMLQQRHRLRTTGLTMKKAANKSKSKPAAKPSDSSTTIKAAAAAASLSAGPSVESQEPSDAPKTGSVPSSAAASTAPVLSKRKTFWQPFLTATANPSAAAAAGDTPAAQNLPEGTSPAFDPPPLPNRKSFWQPYYSPPTAAGAPPVANDSAPPAAVAEPEPPATAETESPKETDSPMEEAPTAAEEVSARTTSAAPPAAEAVPPPQPAAATAASSPPPPSPSPSPAPPVVAFEPVPTLISDSPVYKDVAMTIERAKKSVAPFRKKVQDNVAEGTVGERGEEWAIAQGAILIFVAMGSIPVVGGLVMALAGPGLLVGGLGVIAAGVNGLGKSLSPWPAPVKDNELNTDGIYGVMRHPMYTGLVMVCLGFGVVTNSPLRMLLAALLAFVLDKKVEKEESFLVAVHGEAYESYREAVAKFVPRLY
ncbi:unnamed protein product [Ectocarpus sp. 13 AM-2016]